MISKHKISGILFVNRLETENKWWHRLVNVFIFGTTILVAILAIALFVSNSAIWKTYSYPAFNFEDSYTTVGGKEVDCKVSPKPFDIECNGHVVDSSDYTKRYNVVIKKKIGQKVIDKICAEGKAQQAIQNELGIERLDPEESSCMTLTVNISPIQEDDFPSRINNQVVTYDKYLTSDQVIMLRISFLESIWGTKAKEVTAIIYPVLLQNLLYVILSISCWFIFWESIIYRTVLYIIYGKKKSIG